MIEGLFSSLIYDFLKTSGKLLFGEYAIEFHKARTVALKVLCSEFSEHQIQSSFLSFSNLKDLISFDRKDINHFVNLLRQGVMLEKDEEFIDALLDRIKKPHPYNRNLARIIISRFVQIFCNELGTNHKLFDYIDACRQNAKLEEILRLLKDFIPNYLGILTDILYNSCYAELPKSLNSIDSKLEAIHNHPSMKYYTSLGCGENIVSHESDLDLQHATDAFLKSNIPILLLIGNSGSGKSTFCTHLAIKLINEFQKDNECPLPVLIRLGRATKAAEDDKLIENEFERFGISTQDLAKMKKDREFIFILDGYDELRSKENIFDSNRLGEWKAKVILTCCTQYLEKEKDFLKLFAHIDPIRYMPDQNSLKTLYIHPFSDEKVDKFLQNFSSSEESKWKDWNRYREKITFLYNLKELSSNPLLLFIIVQTLPSLLGKVEEGKIQTTFTRSMLYEEFFQLWFERETHRLRDCLIEPEGFFEFAEELAYEMFLTNKIEIMFKSHKLLMKYDINQIDLFEAFFTSEDIKIIQARSGCPIQRVGDYTYRFMHKSFQEFCVARKLTREIANDNFENLNKKLLTLEPGILRFFPGVTSEG